MKHAILKQRFLRTSGLYSDLIDGLSEANLAQKLTGLPSNEIGEQLWCVVGARESYTRAVKAGEWSGFSCSLENTQSLEEVKLALKSSSETVLALFTEAVQNHEFTEAQVNIILDLLEHEVQHHGQLIRYLFGLKIEIPKSWKTRYAL